MLAISFFMLLFLTLINSLNLKTIARLTPVKNIASASLILGSLITAIVMCCWLLDEATIRENLANLLTDYRMYVCVILEYLGLLLMRQNYVVNGNNVTAINFSLFFSLTLVPVISYYGSDFLGFSETIKVNYKSQTEFFAFTSILTVLVLVYFADKLKGHINNWLYLLSTPVVFSASMFLTAKMMQANNAYIVAFIVCAIKFTALTVTFISKKEHAAINKEHIKPLLKLCCSGIIIFPLSTLIVQLIAVEFITLLKRIAQIITGAITDKIYGNAGTINKKDFIVIIMMLTIGFIMYYFRG